MKLKSPLQFNCTLCYSVSVVCMHRAPGAIKITMFHDKQFVEMKCFNNDTLSDYSIIDSHLLPFSIGSEEKSARENVALVK